MTITNTVNSMMSMDARDIAVRQASAQGWRHINVLQIRQLALRAYEVDLLVAR